MIRLPRLIARARNVGILLLVAILSGVLAFAFHADTWLANDDGAYGYIAWRMSAGDVLHRDLHDVHMGYVHFLHALAWRLFGPDLLSLRFPLMCAAVLAAVLAATLLVEASPLLGLVGGIATVALSISLGMSPTANWYCLPLLLLIAKLAYPDASPSRLTLIGACLGLMFGFRQLSAVLVAPAVLVVLLCANSEGGNRSWPGRLVLGLVSIAFAGYLVRATDGAGFLFFGLAPLAILAWALGHVRASGRRVLTTMTTLTLGAALALLPLFLYHLAHGTLSAWIDDTVLGAVHLPTLPFIEGSSYGLIAVLAASTVIAGGSIASTISGLLWMVALLAAASLGWRLFSLLRTQGNTTGLRLSILCLFYAVVALHYAVPLYLIFTLAPVMLGHLALSATRQDRALVPAAAVVVASVLSLYFHAGQPVSRGLEGIIQGQRLAVETPLGIPHVSIISTQQDANQYRHLVALIEAHSDSDASILAVPWSPELHVTTGRRNPLTFYNTALGIRDEGDLREALERLQRDPPTLILSRPDDKYMTPLSVRLLAALEPDYRLLEARYDFRILIRLDRDGK